MRARKIKRRSEQMEKSHAISHFVGLSPAKKLKGSEKISNSEDSSKTGN